MANEVRIVVTGQDQSAPALTSATRNARGLQSALQDVGRTAAGMNLADVFADMSGAAQEFLRSTTAAASNLEQSIGGVDAVFKQSAGQIHEWGQTSAESVGLSRRAFNEAVTPLGAMLKNLGLSMEDVTDRTGELTTRAADMAATFGGPTQDALDAITAALRGESDPLERYGVLLNEASVNARALADTGKTSADALTLQEKATARLNLIMEQTADTQGKFADEADTVAGAQQRMNAALEDGKAVIGSSFAPVVKVAADVLTTLVQGFQNLPGPIQFVISLLAVMVAGAIAIAPAVTAAATAMGALGISATAAAAGVRTFMIALGPIGLALAVATAAMAAFSDEAVKIETKVDTDAIKRLGNALSGVTDESERLKIATAHFEDTARSTEAFGVSARDMAEAVVLGGEKLQDLRDKINQLRKDFPELGPMLDVGIEALNGYTAALGTTTPEMEKLTGAVDATTQAFQEQTDAVLQARDAQRGLQEAIDQANEAITENGATLDINTQKGRDNQAAIDGIASSTLAAVEADRAKGASGTELLGTLMAGRDAFIAAAVAAGMEANAAVDLANKLGLIPSRVLTRIELDDAYARRRAQEFANLIASIPANKLVNLRVSTQGGGHHLVGQAHGGVLGADRISYRQDGGATTSTTMINEAGPELVELPSGSRVATAGAVRALADAGAFAGGAGDGPIVLQFTSDGSRIGDLLVEIMRESIRVRGGRGANSVQAVLGRV